MLSMFTPDAQRYGRIPDAAVRYGLSKSSLYRLAADGRLVLRKFGRATFVEYEAADRFMASLPLARIKPAKSPAPGAPRRPARTAA